MTKVRLSTTVDGDLLERAREIVGAGTDATMVEQAFRAFIAQHREAEIDASYAAYDDLPPDTPDDWGVPTEFSKAARRAVAEL